MAELKVTLDTRQLKRAIADLGKRAPKAISRAINRTGGTVRTRAVRAVAKEIRLPQKQIRPMLPLIPSNPQFLEAKLIARGRPVSLMRLGARQTKQGVVYKGAGGMVLIRSAFIRSMPKGGRNVFLRDPLPSTKKGTGAWSMNLPIKKQVGSSVAKIILEKGIFAGLMSVAKDLLAKNMAHEAAYLLSKKG